MISIMIALWNNLPAKLYVNIFVGSQAWTSQFGVALILDCCQF